MHTAWCNLLDTVINSKLQSLSDTSCYVVNRHAAGAKLYRANKAWWLCILVWTCCGILDKLFYKSGTWVKCLMSYPSLWVTIIASNCRSCSLLASWQPKCCNCCLVKITSDVKFSPAGEVCLLAIFCLHKMLLHDLIWPLTYLGACAPAHPRCKGWEAGTGDVTLLSDPANPADEQAGIQCMPHKNAAFQSTFHCWGCYKLPKQHPSASEANVLP